MNIYLIEYNNKIIGVYNNYNTAELFILSCLQNNLMIDSANILTFTNNSCYKVKSTQISLVKNDNKKVVFLNEPVNKTSQLRSPLLEAKLSPPFNKNILNTNKQLVIPDIKLDNNIQTPNNTPQITLPKEPNPEFFDLANKKIELQHNINMLKVKKQRIEESKNVFDNDMKLFELFSNNINENNDFVIPELFQKKFTLMNQLKEENRLDWENFTEEYKHVDQSYSDYFTPTLYDLKFENSKE